MRRRCLTLMYLMRRLTVAPDVRFSLDYLEDKVSLVSNRYRVCMLCWICISYVYTYICTYASTHTYTCTCNVWIYIYMHACICKYIYTYTYTYICIRLRIWI